MGKAIEARKLSKKYKDVQALDEVSFTIEEGETYGLLGVNGAGKTTAIKILTGLTELNSGSACILGYELTSELDKIKPMVNVSPQESAIGPNLTVEENLKFFAGIYGKDQNANVEKIIGDFNLADVRKKRAKTLSGGYQRRLSIAIAMVSEPKVLFLDEPTLGLDVLARRELWKEIRSLKGKCSVILTSHYLEEIEALCDRVAIMTKGKVLAIGMVSEIKKMAGATTFEDAFVNIVEGTI